MSTTQGTGWKIADVNAIPPVKPDWPATWKSVRHHFGISSFGVNAVTKDAGNVLIPEHDEGTSGQQELYFVHAGEVRATLDGEAVTIAAGEPPSLGGLDSWFDAATFTRFADTPSIGFGPRSLAWGHTIDEYVPVDDLVSCTQALALAAVDYCGVAG